MNVFRATIDSSDIVDYLKNEILRVGVEENEDISVELSGYVHNKTGFILKVQNMESVTDRLLASWRQIVANKGYLCELSYDFQEGRVDIKCIREEKQSACKGLNLHLLGYLSVGILCIYRLWNNSLWKTL